MPCKMKMHLILLDGYDTASCVSVFGVGVGVFFGCFVCNADGQVSGQER